VAWVKANPNEDYSVLPPLVRIQRISLLLENLQKEVINPFNMAPSDYSVLAALRRTGEPYRMIPSELYAVLERSSGGMTKMLKRLDAQKLIKRIPIPRDGRSNYIQLTKKGIDIERQVFEAYMHLSHQLLDDISKDELAEIDSAVEKLLNCFEKFYYR
jgi:DNA-binding MarR family transcriptional regulator